MKNDLNEKKKRQIAEDLKKLGVVRFYQSSHVNNKTESEVAAQWICDNFDSWTNELMRRKCFIEGRPPSSPYRQLNHLGVARFNSNRLEEMVAYSLVNACAGGRECPDAIRELQIGTFLDYQVPMKCPGVEEPVGKAIDAISYDQEKRTLHIVELKHFGSKETLLRCVAEAFTYALSINFKKLLREYAGDKVNPSDIVLSITPFFFKGVKKKNENGTYTIEKQSQASKDFEGLNRQAENTKGLGELKRMIENFRYEGGPKFKVDFVECDPEKFGFRPFFTEISKQS